MTNIHWGIILLLGWFAGMLVNYLADLLPIDRKLGRPICVTCYHVFSWQVFLFFLQCPQCGARRRLRSWLVQMIYPVVFLYFHFYPNMRLGLELSILFFIFMGLVAVIDLEYRLILNQVSMVGVAVGLIIGLKLHSFVDTILGGVAGYTIMLLLYYLGILFSRLMARIRKEELDEVALGFGDVNLSGILGLVLGWPGITAGLLLAIMLGGAVSLLYIIMAKLSRRYQLFTAIPYAPFLILGAIILLFRPL